MDEKTLRILEFDKVRKILAGYTSFSAGTDLALALEPTADAYEAQSRQAETKEAVAMFETHTDITIGGARDVRRAVDNAERGFTLLAEDFQAIQATIAAARTLRRRLMKLEDEAPHLADIAALIEECPGIVSAINRTIDERGEVLDSASPKLAKIRQEEQVVYSRIQEKLQRLLNSSMNLYLQEPIITMRGGRYVVPLRADAKGRIKGIVHDHSGSGATLWVEPMNTVELNNEYRGLHIREQEEVNRILRELSAMIAEQGQSIKRVVERMAELDLIFARAGYATVIDGVEPLFVPWRTFDAPKPPKHANERAKWTPPAPNLHPGSTIWVKAARHPLIDPEEVVPTNLTLDEDTFTVLITGPNTGGKTVSLKTMGLIVLMAQAGLHVPAVEARLTIFENVFADIGDEQSIEQSLSTFSAHLTNIVRILGQVDDRSLVLLDELGSGTDPTEGAALAQATVSFLRDKGATTFVATHYPELKIYASQNAGAINASLLFDIETLSPTYEMSIGIPGRSNAFAIARRLGLDETILDDAMRLVGAGSHEAEDMLDSIYSLREKIEAEEAGTRLALNEAEQARKRLQKRLEEVENEREQILEETRAQADEELEEIRTELRRARRKIRDASSINLLKKISKEVEQVGEDRVRPPAPHKKVVTGTTTKKAVQETRRALRVGDTVNVKSLGARAEVLDVGKKEAVVAIGRMQMRASYDDLEFKGRPIEDPESEAISEPVASAGMELDLRGRRVDDGLEELDRYLDSAFLSRLPWVRIIHGKGTGRLREAVRDSLSANDYVRSWEEGKDGEGGAGVTVAKIIDRD
ncbi:MAG: Smr/MutS family protein [Candidatus Promineifilaceae bacterium]|nr:Smr/MutS family protein [Candidatus Promineifilaceae bacterium]